MHQVYVILNDKDPTYVYVGTTTNAHHRFIKHCSKSSRCRKLKNAIKRDGRESFRMLVIQEFRRSRDAYRFEVTLIARLKEDGHMLYNLTHGGKGAPGRTVRQLTRSKISTSMKARHARITVGVANDI